VIAETGAWRARSVRPGPSGGTTISRLAELLRYSALTGIAGFGHLEAIVFATTAMFNRRSVFGTVADQAHDAVLAQIGNRYQSLHS
jgi:hypothetical protein